jgi:hypothetical protein
VSINKPAGAFRQHVKRNAQKVQKSMPTFGDYDAITLPPEVHAAPAVCVGWVDFGMQSGGEYRPTRQAQLSFELLDDQTPDGKVILVHKRVFNTSTRSKNFRPVLQALTGALDIRSIEPRSLLGRECLLAIEHKDTEKGTYADVEVKPLRGKSSGKLPQNSMTYFSLHEADFEPKALDDLPEWQRDKIKSSDTYKNLIEDRRKPRPAAEIIGDEMPF